MSMSDVRSASASSDLPFLAWMWTSSALGTMGSAFRIGDAGGDPVPTLKATRSPSVLRCAALRRAAQSGASRAWCALPDPTGPKPE